MSSEHHEREAEIHRVALAYLDQGHDRFSDLYQRCLTNTLLAELAQERGHDPEDTLVDILVSTGELRIVDAVDLVVRNADLIEGLVFTHRLTGEEVERGMVEIEPDLGEVASAAPGRLPDGGEVEDRYDWDDTDVYHPGGSLVGPEGWLGGFDPGDLLGFRLTGGGLEVSVVTESGPGEAEQTALLEAFEEVLDGRSTVGIHIQLVVELALAQDRILFRTPVPPIGDLLLASGLEVEDGWVDLRGLDWEPRFVTGRVEDAASFARERELAECCMEGLTTVVGYSLGRDLDLDQVNAALSHGAVADTFIDWWLQTTAVESSRLARMLEPLLAAGARGQAGARYLMAVHHDFRGEPLDAEGHLEKGINADPSYRPALWMLAEYASDRGDARRAAALWRRAGADPEDEPLQFHEGLLAANLTVGRNEPCPCGSGRKYKQCHLHDLLLPEPTRVTWLLSKVFRHLHSHERHDAIVGLLVDSLELDPEVDPIWELVNDEFIADIAIFEDGGLERFIDDRADLLPEDELMAARGWVAVPLRCWEVVATDGEATLTLKDAAGGETVELYDTTGATTLRPGQLILTRALPGGEYRYPSPAGLTFDAEDKDRLVALLEGYLSPEGWVIWYELMFDAVD